MCQTRLWCIVAAVSLAFVGGRMAMGEDKPLAASAPASKPATQPATAASTQPVDVKFELNDKGLSSLTLGGEDMLASGQPDVFGPKPQPPQRVGDEIVQACAWGSVRFLYSGSADRLTVRIVAENTSAEALPKLQVRVAVLKFPQPPLRRSCDPGQFGTGRGTRSGGIPIAAGRGAQPPVVVFSWPAGNLCWRADELDETTAVLSEPATDGNASLKYPLGVTMGSLAAGQRREITCSLRTAPAAADAFDPAADLLAAFGKKYPMKLKWEDHRPIGMMNLQGIDPSRTNIEKNPRHWLIINGGRPDVSTPQGRTEFAAGVLKLAEGSAKTLVEAGAQGAITWDIEGGQFPSCVYYGTPHLQPKTAPEMEEPVEIEANEAGVIKKLRMPVADAYFRIFRQAGLRVGVCLRPQGMRQDANGVWSQAMLNDQEAYDDLKADIEYSRKRWGCTLFYIDSTITRRADDANRHDIMAAWVLEKLYAENPDVLLIPENQTLRYHTVSAPLDSLAHHGVTNTYAPIRRIWPQAFICTMANDGASVMGKDRNTPELLERRRSEMIAAAAAGDIYMIAGWYMNRGTKEIMEIQKTAATSAPAK